MWRIHSWILHKPLRYILYIIPHIVNYAITHAIFNHLILSQDIPQTSPWSREFVVLSLISHDSQKTSLFFVETEGLLPCLKERTPLLYLGPEESLPPFFFKAHFSINLPHTSRISKSCAALRFSDQYITCTLHAIILCRSLLRLCLPRP